MKKTYTLILLLFTFAGSRAQAPGCAVNISPVNTSTNVNPSPYITLKWGAVSGATSYDIYVGNKVPPSQLVGSSITDSFQLFNASYSTTYDWYVVPKNASGSAIGCTPSTSSFVTSAPPPPPSNNDCSGATTLATATVSGNTVGATQSQPADFCNGATGTADDDVWYQFTAQTTGTVTVTLSGGSSFDGVLEAFSGTCGSLTSITCSDTSQAGGQEQFSMNVVTGSNYFLRVYSFGSGLSSDGSFTISATGSALPISLVSFKGEHTGNNNVLSWVTASEMNNKGFQVLYSFNGVDFRNLSYVPSQATSGNSSSVISYQYTDTKGFGGNVYYRLMQIDKDGHTNYSNVILINGGKINSLTLNAIYPNPAKNILNLVVSSPVNNTIQVRITDLAGKTVHQEAFSIASGGNNLDMDISKLPAGSYFVNAVCNNGCQTGVSKFVKE